MRLLLFLWACVRFLLDKVIIPVGVLLLTLCYVVDRTWLTRIDHIEFVVGGVIVYLFGVWLYYFIDNRLFVRELERVGFLEVKSKKRKPLRVRNKYNNSLLMDKVVTSNERIK